MNYYTTILTLLMISQAAAQKLKECQKLKESDKLSISELQQVTRRTDILSYSLLAEIGQFHQGQTTDMQKFVKFHLEKQRDYYKTVGHMRCSND